MVNLHGGGKYNFGNRVDESFAGRRMMNCASNRWRCACEA